MRKRWVAALIVMGLILGVFTGGVVLSQESYGKNSNTSPFQKLIARVAQTLGIGEDELQSAFDQAVKETRDEALQSKLDSLVEQGSMTPEQAEEYKTWYQSRPDSLSPGLHGRKFGFGRGRAHHGLKDLEARHSIRHHHKKPRSNSPFRHPLPRIPSSEESAASTLTL